MRQDCTTLTLLASALIVAGCGQAGENAATTSNAATTINVSNGLTAADTPPELPSQNTTVSNGVMTAGTTQASLAIVNNTGRTVLRLTISAASENDWGIDMLGMQTLPNGETGQVSFGRGTSQCLWDFRATFEGGETRDWRGVNLCEVSTVTLTRS